MKEILIIRHAKSSWAYPNLKDEERPLNQRGERDGPFMAEFCKKQNFQLSHLVSSPAKRAYSTAKFFRSEFDIPLVKESDLYFGDESDWLHIINELDSEVVFPAFFSHNPTITYLANSFIGDYIENIPTCGIVHLKSSVDKWTDFHTSNTTIQNTFFPKLVR